MAVQQNPHRTENDLADTTHRAYTIVYSASPHPDGHLGFFLPFISVSTALSNCELSCFTLTVMSVHSRFPEVRLAASGGPCTQPHSLCNDWMVLPSLLQLRKLTLYTSFSRGLCCPDLDSYIVFKTWCFSELSCELILYTC